MKADSALEVFQRYGLISHLPCFSLNLTFLMFVAICAYY